MWRGQRWWKGEETNESNTPSRTHARSPSFVPLDSFLAFLCPYHFFIFSSGLVLRGVCNENANIELNGNWGCYKKHNNEVEEDEIWMKVRRGAEGSKGLFFYFSLSFFILVHLLPSYRPPPIRQTKKEKADLREREQIRKKTRNKEENESRSDGQTRRNKWRLT